MVKFDLTKDPYLYCSKNKMITIHGDRQVAKGMNDMRRNPQAEVKGFKETKLFTLVPEHMYFDLLPENQSVCNPHFDGEDICNRRYYLTNDDITLEVLV
jgi:hypothetical protein